MRFPFLLALSALSVSAIACSSSSDSGGGSDDTGPFSDTTVMIDSGVRDSGNADTHSTDSGPSIDSTASDSTATDSTASDSTTSDGVLDDGDTGFDAKIDDAPPHDGGGFLDGGAACTPSDRAAKWASMDGATVTLPNGAATLDLVGDGYGLTLGEAETKLCTSTALGDQFGDGTLVNGWGDTEEVWFRYYAGDGRAISAHLWTGYFGTLTAKSPDDLHTYVVGLAPREIQKDGAAFELPVGWMDDAGFPAVADELYRALVHTLAPSVTPPAGSNCLTDKTCVAGSFGDVAYFYVAKIGFAFWVDNRNAAEPVPSIPTRFDVDFVKP